MSGTVKVHEVIYDTGHGGGAAGDGTAIYRTRDVVLAARFASTHTAWGRPTSVATAEVSRKLAQRWGLA